MHFPGLAANVNDVSKRRYFQDIRQSADRAVRDHAIEARDLVRPEPNCNHEHKGQKQEA